MLLHIHHATRYRYEEPAAYSIQHLRLTPRQDPCQRTLGWRVNAPGHPRTQRDAHGNVMHTLTLNLPHDEIALVVNGEVETLDSPMLLPRGDDVSPLAYLADSPLATPDAAITDFARSALGFGTTREQAMRLMAAVSETIRYLPGTTEVYHTASEAFERKSGVCQDQAHVFIAACRACGIPARYVSGYLYTDSEHVASHAWADVWLNDESGWLACDLTHNRLAYGAFCRLAVGRDYLEASPVRGVRRGGGGEALEVFVLVSDSREALQQAQQAQQ